MRESRPKLHNKMKRFISLFPRQSWVRDSARTLHRTHRSQSPLHTCKRGRGQTFSGQFPALVSLGQLGKPGQTTGYRRTSFPLPNRLLNVRHMTPRMVSDSILKHLRELSHEIRDLDVGHEIPNVDVSELTPLSFYRDYVAKNKPVIIAGALESWPALEHWTSEYLAQRMGPSQITAAVTPDGRADAVKRMPDGQEVFALPAYQSMPFAAFLQALRMPQKDEITYAQSQNNSMSEEFPALMDDISELEWANEAFGGRPEATNFWIGGNESVTSFHKDHYENLYAVVSGVKVFFLLPPSDAYRMSMKRYPLAQYKRDASCRLKLQLKEPPQEVPWSPVDLEACRQRMSADESAKDALFWDDELPRPLAAHVGPGEVLYLPSLWYHYVRQRCYPFGEPVLAVNFWYDMPFDCKAAYAMMCEKMAGDSEVAPAS